LFTTIGYLSGDSITGCNVGCLKYFILSCSPSWLLDNTAHVLSDTASAPSGAPTIQISQDEYNRLRQLVFYQTSHSSTHPSSSNMNAYIVSPHRPWILDSGVSSHMTGIKNKFISLHLYTQFSSVNIVDGTQSLVLGDGVVQATPSLNFKNVLYVLKFYVSLLSISQFTKQHNYNVTFFLS